MRGRACKELVSWNLRTNWASLPPPSARLAGWLIEDDLEGWEFCSQSALARGGRVENDAKPSVATNFLA
jgi:hypothetical protein